MTILEISAGDTAWVLISATLVLLMTPALAFFYGGMVRSKSVLNMMMMSIVTCGIVGVAWVLYGFSFAFGDSIGGFLGNPADFFGMSNVAGLEVGTIPGYVFVGFQSAFAIIAVALVSGAVADRMKFAAWCAFALLWASLVYFPAAHWVFAFDGAVSEKGGFIANTIQALDFAGGTAIHINAGAGALALALVLGKRIGFGKVPMRPHNLTLVMLGAALLWIGWFGFNAGSALGANELAGLTWVNTMVCPAATMLAWLVTERIRDGHATSLGAASGIVAGLVAITPACAVVTPLGAIVIGILAGVGCSMALSLKYRWGYDDSLDVVGVHLVGGLIGTLAIGFLASPDLTGSIDSAGLFYGGGLAQLGRQAAGAGIVLGYSLVVTWLIAQAIDKTIGLRVTPAQETSGIDLAEHAEVGYDLSKVQYSTYNKTLLIADPNATRKDDATKVSA